MPSIVTQTSLPRLATSEPSPTTTIVATLAVLALAAGLRLSALDRYPLPVHQDELSNVYDAWSLAETGADRAGRRWPILCRGFGERDNRPALLAWLAAAPSAIVGFSVPAGRAVSAILGLAAVGVVGLWAKRALGREHVPWAMLVLSVSPWHVQFSRVAHEGSALPGLFCVLIVLLLGMAVRIPTTVRWASAGLAIGASTNVYAASRVTGLLFAVTGVILLLAASIRRRERSRADLSRLVAYVAAVAAGASPQIVAFAQDPGAFLGRLESVIVIPGGVYDAVETFVRNVLTNFSPRYLFAAFGEYNNFTVARCSIVEAPLLVLGLFTLCWPGSTPARADRWLLLVGLLICATPAAITRANPHALRASGCAVLLPMIAAVGLATLLNAARRHWPRRRTVVGALVAGAVLTGGGREVGRYRADPSLAAIGQQPELVDLGRWLRDRYESFDRVYVEPHGLQMDLYVAAYTGVHPRRFQQAPREVWGRYSDICTRWERFRFVSRDQALQEWEASPKNQRWLVTDVSHTSVITLSPDLLR